MSKNRGNSQRIQHRRGSAAEWTVNNPILFAGELGYETDTTRIKFGDGVTQWANLTYVGQFGASDLDSLTDVSITSPASGAVLRYDGASWIDAVLSKSDVGLPSVPNVDATARANHTGTQPASTITGLAASATTDTTNAANIGSGVLPAARLPAATTTTVGGVVIGSGLGVASGTVSVTYGTASGTACQGNDARLSDARVPTSHTHGNITNAGAIGSTSGQIVVTTTSGVLTTAATISSASVSGLGTIATQNANSVAITGGSVNGTTIGATTASTGAFTTVTTTGNVGIGTTSPAARLDVQGGRSFFSASSEQYAIGARFSPAGGAVYFGAVSSSATPDAVISNAGGVTLMTLQNGGNVGIGTTGPTANLHVASASDATVRLSRTSGATLDFLTTASAGFVNVSSNHSLVLRTNNTDRVFVDTSGNVGIGTTSPQNRLHVDSAASFSPLSVGGSDAVSGIQFRNTGATLGYIYYDTTPSMIFYVAASEKMRILTNGNVGIGTASPTTRLDVAAVSTIASGTWAGGTDFVRLLAASGSAFSEQAIAFQEAGCNVGAKIGVKNQGNGAYDIVFANRDNSSLTSAFAERARITAAGNVGIGTASPTYRLDVRGGSAAVINSAADSSIFIGEGLGANEYGYLRWDRASNILKLATQANPITFGSDAAEWARVDTNGNVGIGTASPAISSGVGLHLSGSTLRLGTARTPASSTATGNQGEVCWDSSYLYVCIATNTWRRIALTTW
jgi:hypothetical protein